MPSRHHGWAGAAITGIAVGLSRPPIKKERPRRRARPKLVAPSSRWRLLDAGRYMREQIGAWVLNMLIRALIKNAERTWFTAKPPATKPAALPCPPYVPFSWTAIVGLSNWQWRAQIFTSSPVFRSGDGQSDKSKLTALWRLFCDLASRIARPLWKKDGPNTPSNVSRPR